MDKLPELLEPWFIFSLIWSVGATIDNDGRKKYSDWLREKMQTENLKMQFPKEDYVYDYILDDGGIFNQDDSKDEEEEKKVKAV